MAAPIVALLRSDGPTKIVRASGDELLTLCAEIFKTPKEKHFLALKTSIPIKTRWGSANVDGVVLLFRKGCSYTREEMVEFHLPCHLAANEVVVRMFRAGVRHAAPGEFTMRAFLNNRITLAQAEAINALVRAETEAARREAMGRLLHATGQKIRKVYEELQEVRAEVEARLDFPDEDIEEADLAELKGRIETLRREVEQLGGGGEGCFAIPRVLISGPPNAGKSSLLNRLVERDVAVVHPTAGTTRDWVEVETEIGSRRLLLVDSPGETPSFSEVVKRLKEESALVVEVVGADQVEESGIPLPDGRRIAVVNKADRRPDMEVPEGVLLVSALTGQGIEELKRAIEEKLPEGGGYGGVVVREVAGFLAEAEERVQEMELSAQFLRWAAEGLGNLLGVDLTEDMLSRIFGQFCVGK